MITVTATEMKNNFGKYLMKISGEPIIINKNNITVAVMISPNEYQRLLDIENKMLLNEAKKAADKGFLNDAESKELMDKIKKYMNEE